MIALTLAEVAHRTGGRLTEQDHRALAASGVQDPGLEREGTAPFHGAGDREPQPLAVVGVLDGEEGIGGRRGGGLQPEQPAHLG